MKRAWKRALAFARAFADARVRCRWIDGVGNGEKSKIYGRSRARARGTRICDKGRDRQGQSSCARIYSTHTEKHVHRHRHTCGIEREREREREGEREARRLAVSARERGFLRFESIRNTHPARHGWWCALRAPIICVCGIYIYCASSASA